MKGKKISSYNPLTLGGAFTSMLRITTPVQHYRQNTKTKLFTVDTVLTPDTNCFETGILAVGFNDYEWVIVEEYETQEESVVGHKKWVKYMKTNPKTLFDIHIDKTYKLKNI